jgi:hypothetical protein
MDGLCTHGGFDANGAVADRGSLPGRALSMKAGLVHTDPVDIQPMCSSSGCSCSDPQPSSGRVHHLSTLGDQNSCMATPVKVRRLSDEEGRQLQRTVRRGGGKTHKSIVKWRRFRCRILVNQRRSRTRVAKSSHGFPGRRARRFRQGVAGVAEAVVESEALG